MYGENWTAARVINGLIVGLDGFSVFSPKIGVFEPLDPTKRRIRAADLFSVAVIALGRGTPEHTRLLTYVSRAHAVRKAGGKLSPEAYCAEMQWSHQSLYASARDIAVYLNARYREKEGDSRTFGQ